MLMKIESRNQNGINKREIIERHEKGCLFRKKGIQKI